MPAAAPADLEHALREGLDAAGVGVSLHGLEDDVEEHGSFCD